MAPVNDLLADVVRSADRRGRPDLKARLEEAGRRAARTETVVCVVGEFKQGKSALINALLGEDACPVDDDVATIAVTVVRYADDASAIVRRRGPDGPVVESVRPADVAAWVTERENPENRKNVDVVELGLPNPLLQQGLTLIDTPGVGGLNAAHAAATLAFLPIADALVFVTDASAELSRPELDFLATARGIGPQILVGLTKIDLYAEWRRIQSINDRRLADLDGALPSHPLSSVLARETGTDAGLEAESAIAAFSRELVGPVAERARRFSTMAAIHETEAVLSQLREPLTTELEAVENPAEATRLAAELTTVRERLDGLRDASSSWSVRLDDEFVALRGSVEFSFHGRMREILGETQEGLENIDPARSWQEFSQGVQQQVAGAVRDSFIATNEGAARIQAIVAGLLADEGIGAVGDDQVGLDVSTMWQEGQAFSGTARSGLVGGFALLAGATVGVEILGMLGALLGTALVGPAMLGATLFFGGKEVLEERRRRLSDRRQEARAFIARFVENVEFEVDGRISGLITELQREMRSRFGTRIGELTRTARETATALEATIERTEAERAQRRGELPTALDELDRLAGRAADLRS